MCEERERSVVHLRLPRRLVLEPSVRDSVADAVRTSHPTEAGGYLACERRGDRLLAVEHVAVENEADEPTRRFVTTVDERAPPPPRVFYHSHTSAASPSGLTRVDRRHIPERYALVVFAPHGDPLVYRLFRRGLLPWREVPVEVPTPESESESERSQVPQPL